MRHITVRMMTMMLARKVRNIVEKTLLLPPFFTCTKKYGLPKASRLSVLFFAGPVSSVAKQLSVQDVLVSGLGMLDENRI